MTNTNSPLFCRCRVGKNKWFWVVLKGRDVSCYRQAEASGYAESAMDAETQARAAIQLKHSDVAAYQAPAYYAAGIHHREAVKQRAKTSSSATTTKEIEYLYTDYDGDYSYGSFAHRIIKKTTNRIYVAKYPVQSANEDDNFEEDGQTFHDVETIVLDRHKLEAEGCAYSRRLHEIFHTTPWESRHKPATTRCLDLLGLEGGATAETIKAAYRRLAKEHHPDHGGNAEEFKRLQEAYEMAMSNVA